MTLNDLPTEVTIRIRPDVDERVQALRVQCDALLRFAEDRQVLNAADEKSAAEDLGMLATLKKAIAEKREEWYRPIKEKLDAVDSVFKELADLVATADKTTRDKVTAYRREQERLVREAQEINRQKEELARREAAFNYGEVTINTTPVAVPKPPPQHVYTAVGSMGTTRTPKFEIVDPKLIPAEYLMIDVVKIGKVVRASKGDIIIPGVRVYFEDGLRVTGSR